MKITAKQYAEALFSALAETDGKDHDKVMDNFVKVLTDNGDLGLYNQISEEFVKTEMAARNVREAEVTVARPQDTNQQLVEKLNEVIGSKVEVKKKIDEEIIGGVVVRVDDTLIDASVKTQLDNLNKALKE